MRLVWVAVVVGTIFVLLSVSCGPAGRCTPSSCAAGCCDTSGVCQSGRSSNACGKNGSSCSSCLLGQTCDLGTCTGGFNNGAGTSGGGFTTSGGTTSGGTTGGGFVTGGGTAGGTVTGGGATGPCNSQTCSGGCCDFAGVCQAGTTTTACGSIPTTGGACIACGGGQICQNRACVIGTAGGTAGGGTAGGPTGGGTPSCTNGCLFQNQCLVAGSVQQTNSLCGNAGITCRACTDPAFPVCNQGFCSPGGAGGGGPLAGGIAGGGIAGGGTAGGGVVPGCTPLSLPNTFPGGAFTAYDKGYQLLNPGSYNLAYFSSTDTMIGFEFVRASTGVPALPSQAPITTDDYDTCQDCILYAEGCTSFTPSLSCTRRYLAQAGLATVNTASESTTSGIFSGTVTNVIFREWNFTSHAAVVGGRCYSLASASYSVSWP